MRHLLSTSTFISPHDIHRNIHAHPHPHLNKQPFLSPRLLRVVCRGGAMPRLLSTDIQNPRFPLLHACPPATCNGFRHREPSACCISRRGHIMTLFHRLTQSTPFTGLQTHIDPETFTDNRLCRRAYLACCISKRDHVISPTHSPSASSTGSPTRTHTHTSQAITFPPRTSYLLYVLERPCHVSSLPAYLRTSTPTNTYTHTSRGNRFYLYAPPAHRICWRDHATPPRFPFYAFHEHTHVYPHSHLYRKPFLPPRLSRVLHLP